MKKVLHLLKIYKLLIIGLALGVVISLLSVYYASPIYYNGKNVSYNNQSSGMTSTNVKDALDEIYAKANSNQIIKRFSATTNEKPGIMTTGTYTSCGGGNYTCSTRTLDYNYSITGDFEIGFDSWFYNQTAELMGGYDIVFKNGNNVVMKIEFHDSWNEYNRIHMGIAELGTTKFSEDYTHDSNTNTSNKCGTPNIGTMQYRIVRESKNQGKITVYASDNDANNPYSCVENMYDTSLPSTITITSIEVSFLKYSNYQVVPSTVSNIYIGLPRNN